MSPFPDKEDEDLILGTAHFGLCWIKGKAKLSVTHIWRASCAVEAQLYTGCPRRNVPDFGRVFLMLRYTDITQNTYVQSWTVKELMAREKCGLLAGPRSVPVSWQSYPCPSLSVVSYDSSSAHDRHTGMRGQPCYVTAGQSFVMYSAWNPKDNYDMSASVFVAQFNGFMKLTS